MNIVRNENTKDPIDNIEYRVLNINSLKKC